MTDLHHHYDQLTDQERGFVDRVCGRDTFKLALEFNIVLRGDDTAERAVDAVARWVIESRDQRKFGEKARTNG